MWVWLWSSISRCVVVCIVSSTKFQLTDSVNVLRRDSSSMTGVVMTPVKNQRQYVEIGTILLQFCAKCNAQCVGWNLSSPRTFKFWRIIFCPMSSRRNSFRISCKRRTDSLKRTHSVLHALSWLFLSMSSRREIFETDIRKSCQWSCIEHSFMGHWSLWCQCLVFWRHSS